MLGLRRTCMRRQRSLCEASSSARLASRSALSRAAASSASRCCSSVWACAPALREWLQARGLIAGSDILQWQPLSSHRQPSALVSNDCRPGLRECNVNAAVCMSINGSVRSSAAWVLAGTESLQSVGESPPVLHLVRRRLAGDAGGARVVLRCGASPARGGRPMLLGVAAEQAPCFSSRDAWPGSRQQALRSFWLQCWLAESPRQLRYSKSSCKLLCLVYVPWRRFWGVQKLLRVVSLTSVTGVAHLLQNWTSQAPPLQA